MVRVFTPPTKPTPPERRELTEHYRVVRNLSTRLIEPLSPEDCVVQSMPDCSPTKWHLAHTTWFFERFVLRAFDQGFAAYDDRYEYLFNSYYNAVGKRQARPKRGMLTRPGLGEVLAYRDVVDERLLKLLGTCKQEDYASMAELIEIGLHHEQQHQELLLMDVKHLLSLSPMPNVAYDSELEKSTVLHSCDLRFLSFDGGILPIGTNPADGFCFDNETPAHEALIHPFEIANRCVTNAEYAEFVADDGYRRSEFWLDAGWTWVNTNGIEHPMYWCPRTKAPTSIEDYSEYTLGGDRALAGAEPVSHVSFFEADAYARWAGCRLPTEFEWEHAACETGDQSGQFDLNVLHPRAANQNEEGTAQMQGNVWQWTSSAYLGYPGYAPVPGALGEYNGKFMNGQMVARGSSCLTPPGHARVSYRNFFHPDKRWVCVGLRLAKDA
ncbi:MAG: ergothioneine biosynthesis protein EgtB [Planctomycetota bacterium]